MEQENLIQSRLRELAEKAYQQNVYTYTHFLSMAELDLYCRMRGELNFISHQTFGGNAGCERQMVSFGSEDEFGYPGEFPIALLCVEPNAEKFAEELTHRDYLGALLNLGMEREMLGDIVVRGKRAYIYCVDTAAAYLQENLVKVRHTYVSCRLVENSIPEVAPVLEERIYNVASERIDVLVAAVVNESRSKSSERFTQKKIFLNGRQMENPGYQLRQGDVLSIRGYGKLIYDGLLGETRKGRCRVVVRKYL